MALHGPSDAKRGLVEVDVGPSDPEGFSLS
jgi:hypothetical protein